MAQALQVAEAFSADGGEEELDAGGMQEALHERIQKGRAGFV